MSKTNIEWCNRPGTLPEVWNVVTGCDKVSQGCKNCYAEIMHRRLQGMYPKKYNHDFLGGAHVHEDLLTLPLTWKKPRTIFVNSMSDLFHKDVPFKFIDKVFAVMALCPQHTFQILTKRADRLLDYFKSRRDSEYFEEEAETIACTEPHLVYQMEIYGKGRNRVDFPTNKLLTHIMEAGWYSDLAYVGWGEEGDYDKELEFIYEGPLPLPNVWLGVSVENQQAADERIPSLLQVPAAVRFLSCEPLLGAVDISQACNSSVIAKGFSYLEFQRLHWVIAGGESGHKARAMNPDWVRSLRDQCTAADVPFFFKQWGEWGMHESNTNPFAKTATFENSSITMVKIGKHESGRLLDGREWNEFPNTQEK